jgi:D-alanine-D-alanine ligase-like ATP-grasp enzyme
MSHRCELILGIIIIGVSVLSVLHYDHVHQVREQQHLLEKAIAQEEKQFAIEMYHEIRKVICTIIKMEQLLPISRRSYINISYPCPNILE